MTSDIGFVSVAFGDRRYLEQQDRLRHSILSIYEDASLYFWHDQLPPGSKSFSASLYGFKPHAVDFAKHRHKKVVFFDPACILMDRLDYYDELAKQYGVIAVQDDNKLSGFCYDKAIKWFGLTRNNIQDWHLVGGSVYYFDFEQTITWNIFEKWSEAERNGLFGSQQDQASGKLHGHRSDEAIMSLALYTSGSKPLAEDTRYRCNGCIVDKKHFK